MRAGQRLAAGAVEVVISQPRESDPQNVIAPRRSQPGLAEGAGGVEKIRQGRTRLGRTDINGSDGDQVHHDDEGRHVHGLFVGDIDQGIAVVGVAAVDQHRGGSHQARTYMDLLPGGDRNLTVGAIRGHAGLTDGPGGYHRTEDIYVLCPGDGDGTARLHRGDSRGGVDVHAGAVTVGTVQAHALQVHPAQHRDIPLHREEALDVYPDVGLDG